MNLAMNTKRRRLYGSTAKIYNPDTIREGLGLKRADIPRESSFTISKRTLNKRKALAAKDLRVIPTEEETVLDSEADAVINDISQDLQWDQLSSTPSSPVKQTPYLTTTLPFLTNLSGHHIPSEPNPTLSYSPEIQVARSSDSKMTRSTASSVKVSQTENGSPLFICGQVQRASGGKEWMQPESLEEQKVTVESQEKRDPLDLEGSLEVIMQKMLKNLRGEVLVCITNYVNEKNRLSANEPWDRLPESPLQKSRFDCIPDSFFD